MPDQALAALRKLTEAVMAEFFGNDTNLSKRLIQATNEAQLLLMVQPPDNGRVNRPALAEPVALVEPVEPPTSDEKERLLETARAAQVAGTFPTDSAIRLLTDDYGWNESEQRHCMAAARLALAYWGHAWGYLATNHHAPAPDQVPEPTKMVAPPAEGEVGELVAWLQQRCQLMSEAPGSEFHLFTRAADLLKQQAAELAMLRQVASPVTIPGEAYHDDMGPVTWWRFPVEEAPWVGTPGDSGWPGYHTHFTPCPLVPAPPEDRPHD